MYKIRIKNDNMFKTPFSINYWKNAINEFKGLESLILISVLIALRIVIGMYFINISSNIRIYFTFIIVALSGLIFGPIVGMVSGGISDLIGFMLFPSGAFFIGYTISAILSGFIFGLFLYRTKITIFKLLLSKFLVNFIVNSILGTLWRVIMTSNYTMEYFLLDFIPRLTKNMILLPIEVIILFLLFRRMIPILKDKNLISMETPDKIKAF